jgi:hypothetical protein
MANARATLFLNSVAFVRERFSPEAAARVHAALPLALQAWLDGGPRETAWRPVEDLVAYMSAARALVAPDDPGFYRELGRFAGLLDRRERGVGTLFTDVDVAARMAGVIWRTYFDAGRLEASPDGDALRLRIHDFPARRELCERIVGSLEGQWAELQPLVAKSACRLDGAPCCEIRVGFPGRSA